LRREGFHDEGYGTSGGGVLATRYENEEAARESEIGVAVCEASVSFHDDGWYGDEETERGREREMRGGERERERERGCERKRERKGNSGCQIRKETSFVVCAHVKSLRSGVM
jgi:hypothetical protein